MHGKIPLWWPEMSKCGSMNLGGNFTESSGGCWRYVLASPIPGKLEQGSLAQVRRQVHKSL